MRQDKIDLCAQLLFAKRTCKLIFKENSIETYLYYEIGKHNYIYLYIKSGMGVMVVRVWYIDFQVWTAFFNFYTLDCMCLWYLVVTNEIVFISISINKKLCPQDGSIAN